METGADKAAITGASTLLLGVSFESGNMGVGALASGAVEVLSSRFGGSIALLDYSKAANERLPVRIGAGVLPVGRINLRFSWKLFLPNNVFTLIALACLCRVPGFRPGIVASNATLREIDAAKAAFALSGGDSFSDIYGLERFFYVSLPIVLAMVMRKRVVLLPQTIGPFERSIPRAVAARLLRQSSRIYSRDRYGVDEARTLIGDLALADKVRFSHDLGFVLQSRRPDWVDYVGPPIGDATSETIVGLNVSGLLMMGGYDQHNMFNLKVGYKDLVDALVRHFCETDGVRLLLVPHVFGDHAESDQVACRAVYENHVEKYGARISHVASRHDQSEIKHIIGQCGFFVGARMHACIAALSQSVPAICVAYSRKFVGVLESIDAENLVVDPRTMTLTEIIETVARRFAERRQLAAKLAAGMPDVKRGVLAMMNDLDLRE